MVVEGSGRGLNDLDEPHPFCRPVIGPVSKRKEGSEEIGR